MQEEPETARVLPSALFPIATTLAFPGLAAFSLIETSLTQVRAIAGASAAAFFPIATAIALPCFTEFPLVCASTAQRFAMALHF